MVNKQPSLVAEAHRDVQHSPPYALASRATSLYPRTHSQHPSLEEEPWSTVAPSICCTKVPQPPEQHRWSLTQEARPTIVNRSWGLCIHWCWRRRHRLRRSWKGRGIRRGWGAGSLPRIGLRDLPLGDVDRRGHIGTVAVREDKGKTLYGNVLLLSSNKQFDVACEDELLSLDDRWGWKLTLAWVVQVSD